MTYSAMHPWLDAWGYLNSPELHINRPPAKPLYAYRNEVEELFDPNGPIRAKAVFDIEGVPSVCFIENDGHLGGSSDALSLIRAKIWNQNLISIVLLISEETAQAIPASRPDLSGEILDFSTASETSPYSRRYMQSGNVFENHLEWFRPENQVDHDLLKNLCRIVKDLEQGGLSRENAQYLMMQILFVSYLEDRGIVGDKYRTKHGLSSLGDMVYAKNPAGIIRLFGQLKHDFNGDFLEPENQDSLLWNSLTNKAFDRLNAFLRGTNLETGQQRLWPYDFRYIPVELISGIYETFLSDEKRNIGAYYTPRHLANLVVDQVFSDSEDILSELIYDGACGSGILLTTAYRRMISYAEATTNRPLFFKERLKLLREHIFGSDLNLSACRVTSFSLYLSILEGLQPADISELQDNENIKLPTLREENILGGPDVGDFFSRNNLLATSGKFTIFLSNPPWVEPKGREILSSDQWASENDIEIPRRNTAGAFALRVRDSLSSNGRFCLVLPISLLASVSKTSANFLKTWMGDYKLETLINFGDLRNLLFTTAKQPCVIAVGRCRSISSMRRISPDETFEYWVPKADISFAFGRLTLHSSDRHRLSTHVVCRKNELLISLFWGTMRDVASIARLKLQGTIGDMFLNKGTWHIRKGFHKSDASNSNPVSSQPLRRLPYLSAQNIHADSPVVDQRFLSIFPDDIKTISRLPEVLLEGFGCPKIVFTDGITKDRSIRAAFSKEEFSFNSSVGVIFESKGKEEDESVLRFLAIYLRSKLAQYLLILTAYQVNFERERVTLDDIRQMPFIHPDKHPQSKNAWRIVRDIANRTREFEKKTNFLEKYNSSADDELIFEYFNLDSMQRDRVREVSDKIAPYLQPGSIGGLSSPLQGRPSKDQVDLYGKVLLSEIDLWREARGGTGTVIVSIDVNSTSISGSLGIIRIEPTLGQDANSSKISTVNDREVDKTLNYLRQNNLLPLKIQNNLYLATDVVIRSGETIYLVKPLIGRLWLLSEAYQDAERIVCRVLSDDCDLETDG